MSSPPTALSPLYRPVGDHGLLVEFGETISQETHALVLRLDAALSANRFEGFRESVGYARMRARAHLYPSSEASVPSQRPSTENPPHTRRRTFSTLKSDDTHRP